MATAKDSKVVKTARKPPNAGKGRVKGVPNKNTALVREAFANFVENNVGKFQGWLEDVAEDPKHGPKVALELVLHVSEFYIPKLARTEHVGDNGGPVEVRIDLIEKIAARRAARNG